MDKSKWFRVITSRKIWAALIDVVALILRQAGIDIPDDVIQAMHTLVLALIGAWTVEDAVRWYVGRK